MTAAAAQEFEEEERSWKIDTEGLAKRLEAEGLMLVDDGRALRVMEK